MLTTLPEDLVKAIESGRAVLFTGAGFSSGCVNFLNQSPPRAKQLAHNIASLGGFERDDDLAYVSDRYLKENPEREVLIDWLKDNYTLKSTDKAQRNIVNLPWMRCYTTNYDNSIEVSGQEIGKRFQTAVADVPPSQYPKKNLVVHINGSIDRLSAETLDSSFKLTESSYNSARGFLGSAWFHNFKNDISRCSALVFVGYSLYDIDIKRIVSSCDGLNVYFVTQKDITEKNLFVYEQYGTVIDCGVENFGDLVKGVNVSQVDSTLSALEECLYAKETRSVRDEDLERLFMYGIVNQHLVEESLLGEGKGAYFFYRPLLEDVEKSIAKTHVVITSELGNGKSAFLKQLTPFLLSKSHRVYIIKDSLCDVIADIEMLVSRGKHFVLLIDNYYLEEPIIQHVAQNYSCSEFTIIATARPSFHDRENLKLKEWGLEYVQYSLDYMYDSELDGLVSIIDSLGQWGDLAGLTHEKKKEWVKFKNDSSLAYFLLALFDSEDIRKRIDDDIKSIISNPEFKDIIFAISIINVANLPIRCSLVEEGLL